MKNGLSNNAALAIVMTTGMVCFSSIIIASMFTMSEKEKEALKARLGKKEVKSDNEETK